MTDIVPAQKRSEMMSGIRAKNTKPELVVRSFLHATGFRFRLHRKDLPGKPDIVLPKWRTVIFVHGCFWHGHENCHLYRLPKSRTEFWRDKIEGNRRRDELARVRLREAGWKILVVWECALRGKNKDTSWQKKLENSLVSPNLAEHQISGIRKIW